MHDCGVKGLFFVGLGVVAVAGCASAPTGPAPSKAGAPTPSVAPEPEVAGTAPSASPAPPSAQVVATMKFCAYGGLSTPSPPGAESVFASMVVEVDNPGSPVGGVSVVGASLLDAKSAPLASLRRLDHFVVFTPAPPSPALGSFAVHLNPTGTPFTGELPAGRTTLRVRMSLDRAPSDFPDRCHVELAGLGSVPLVVEGRPDGVWGT